MKWYCMEKPDGTLIETTIASSKIECWYNSFVWVADELGKEWRAKYWKRDQASKRSAEKQGWKIVQVKLIRVHPKRRIQLELPENGQIANYAYRD